MNKPKIIAVVGPTASGKSALAIKLAQDFNGEIISADSRQFYRGMDIGTAKVTKEEQEIVPHHFIDILDPNEPFSLYEYQKQAFKKIDEVLKRGKLPIIVGGTGMYVSSLIENYRLSEKNVDQKFRDELNAKDLNTLVAQLQKLNPQTTVDLKNKRRVVRELEYLLQDPGYQPSVSEPLYDVLLIQPKFEREELYKRINKRVKEMVDNGLLSEIDNLVEKYGWEANALTAIGYREFYGLENVKNLPQYRLDKIIEQIKQNSRNYAKRQMTWFRRYGQKLLEFDDYSGYQQQVEDFLNG